MTVSIAGRNVAIGAIVAAVGGAIAMVGSLLVWAAITRGAGLGGPATDDVKGLDFNNGKIVLGLGIVVLGLVVAWVLDFKIVGIGGMVAVFGALILAVMALTYFTGFFYPRTMPVLARVNEGDLKAALNAFNDAVSTAKEGVDTTGSSAGLGIGFFLEIAAGVLMIVGGGLGLIGGRLSLMKKSAQPPQPPTSAPRSSTTSSGGSLLP
jgi:hypothetical protein